MAAEILSPLQKKFISLFAANKMMQPRFYLTGGTALAAYYLHHRLSEDLDFFSSTEVELLGVDTFLSGIKRALSLKKIDFQQSFNRNLFFLHGPKEVLKAEFTFFPFEQIEKPAVQDGLLIDGLIDIAVNKTFAIFQNPRARDFIDLYLILQQDKKLSIRQLIRMARSKFNSQIDPLQMGTQMVKAKTIQDLPVMLKKIGRRPWRSFFVQQAQTLSGEIFK